MNISILGAGNTGTQLAFALHKAGHKVLQVFSRTPQRAELLAHKVNAVGVTDVSNIDGDIIIIAVKDDAIQDVASQIISTNKIVVHTSGTVSMQHLSGITDSFGVFYPLQTMKQDVPMDFKQVPLLIEAANESTKQVLLELARSISGFVYEVDEQQRQWAHLSAVFSHNFTNHMFTISESLLQQQGLPFDILKPLIYKLFENLDGHSPFDMQTGPAMRQDFNTIAKHMELLANEHRLKTIYEIMSSSIVTTYYGDNGKPKNDI